MINNIRKKSAGGLKSNTRALTELEKGTILSFLRRYAESYALALPGRMEGYKNNEMLLLPSSHTKQYVYDKYAAAANSAGNYIRSLSCNTNIHKREFFTFYFSM